MRVDQPRHQGATLEIDRAGDVALDRPVRNFADPVALDQHMVILAALFVRTVEHRAIGEYDRRHWTPLCTPRLGPIAEPAEAG